MENTAEILKEGGVVVLKTDTIYGILCSALNPVSVERVYEIRKRAPTKPCIILISDFSEVKKFGVVLSNEQNKIIETYPKPVSVVLDCDKEEYKYLHRGTNTLAFRVPEPKELRDLLLQTGPLIAPSANTEGLPPSKNIAEARGYFGDQVDLYVDGGEALGKASRVIKINANGTETVLRP